MNIQSITTSSQLRSLSNVKSSSADITATLDSSDSTSISDPAELFKKLEDLSKSAPAKFKEAVNSIAKELDGAADSATDPQEKQMLTDLAKRFSKAGETGDASDLKPPTPPAGGAAGARPSSGADDSSEGGGSSGTKVYDPADANQDGVVTAKERADYEAKMASKKAEGSTGHSAYRSEMDGAAREKMDALFASMSSIVDSAMNGQVPG